MDEINDFEDFHPRAVKLLRKHKNFIVIAEDEPYFIQIYRLIRKNEKAKGAWSDEDESIYKYAMHRSMDMKYCVCKHPVVEKDFCFVCQSPLNPAAKNVSPAVKSSG